MQVELTQEQSQALVYFATVGIMAMTDFDKQRHAERIGIADDGIVALILAQD